MYVVDTNVISALASTQDGFHAGVVEWLEQNSRFLYLSVITATEIEDGIAKAERTGARHKASRLRDWLDALLHLYSERVLWFDVDAARLAGRLSDLARGRRHRPGLADLAIAATALGRGYVVLTRNLRHFAPLDVSAHDLFAGPPIS